MNKDSKIEIYDCGCVISRPKDPSVKNYGTRWRAYITHYAIKLKCRDCGRMHTFKLVKAGVESIQYQLKDEIDRSGEDKE